MLTKNFCNTATALLGIPVNYILVGTEFLYLKGKN